MKPLQHRRLNPRFREMYRLLDLYGSDVFHAVGDTFELSSDDIVLASRLNPRLGNPLSLIETWNGNLVLKQEHYVQFYEDDVEALERAYQTIQAQPDQDFESEVGQLHFTYQAQEKHIFLKAENTQIAFGRASVAVLGRLIESLKHHLPVLGEDDEGKKP